MLVLPVPMFNEAELTADTIESVPLIATLFRTVSAPPGLIASASPASSVNASIVAELVTVTEETTGFPLSIRTSNVVPGELFGTTPPLQLPAALHAPAPPFPVATAPQMAC